MRKGIRNFSVICTSTLVLFIGANIASYLLFAFGTVGEPEISADRWSVDPISEDGMQTLKRVLASEDESFLRALANEDPGIRPHPVLHFTQGRSTEHYRVSIEGIRSEPDWTDTQVRTWLDQPYHHSYVFGGSTAFGHGVAGDQTVSAFLNRFENATWTLNFAVQAYDSTREVDLLLYLLRKGYRPRQAIFIDGLNDITTFASSPYQGIDKPRMQALLMDRGQVPLIFGHPRRNNMLQALLFSFPAVQLYHRLIKAPGQAVPYRHKDASQDLMDWQELMLHYTRWDQIQSSRSAELSQELIDHFKRTQEFVGQIGQAFVLEPLFVYQPIGLLQAQNPFLKPVFQESSVYKIFKTLDAAVRKEIKSGTLNMLDCSQSITDARNGYVDVAHYSPAGNESLASCIRDHIDVPLEGSGNQMPKAPVRPIGRVQGVPQPGQSELRAE